MTKMCLLFIGFLLILVASGRSIATAVDRPVLPSQPTPLLALGQTLFFDVHLSKDETVSCAFCHQPEKAFSDGRKVAQGVHRRRGTRNTPSLRNANYSSEKFWDGRRPSLEAQVLDPFFNTHEHGLRDEAELFNKLKKSFVYDDLWQKAFGHALSSPQMNSTEVVLALSTYIRSLQQTNAPLDRYLFQRDATALSLNERRGLELFRGRAQGTACHRIDEAEAPLTDGEYHSLALGFDALVPKLAHLTKTIATTPRQELDRLITVDANIAALGRFIVTQRPVDIGKFKTPSLRNVADTAPYMHDGSIPSLEDAVDREIYYRGKALGRPLVLSLAERADLLAFLTALKDVPVQRQE